MVWFTVGEAAAWPVKDQVSQPGVIACDVHHSLVALHIPTEMKTIAPVGLGNPFVVQRLNAARRLQTGSGMCRRSLIASVVEQAGKPVQVQFTAHVIDQGFVALGRSGGKGKRGSQTKCEQSVQGRAPA